ncbi:MAG: hypothetical protein HEP71_12760 [Roseivirga sp.]|nr:hypothetical protein [Roseivirga sp.]
MGNFLSYKRQKKATETRKAFAKAKSLYGKHMEDAPVASTTKKVRTNFDELLDMRNSRSERFQRGYKWFFFFLAIGLVIFVIVNFIILSHELS